MEDQPDLYYFYGDTCPHCTTVEKHLPTVSKETNTNIKKMEVKKYTNLSLEALPLLWLGT